MRREIYEKALLGIALLVLPGLACNLLPGVLTTQDTSPTAAATIAEAKSIAATPTNTTAVGSIQPTASSARITQTPGSSQPTAAISTLASSTRPPNTPTVTITPRPTTAATATIVQTGCPAPSLPSAKPSSIVKSATTAQDYDRNADAIIGPTTEFKSNSVVHAVVTVQNAPTNTTVKTKWYANDVGKAAPCNTFIGEPELTIDATPSANLDFKQGPIIPIGTFRVEVYVNGTLDRVLTFTIK